MLHITAVPVIVLLLLGQSCAHFLLNYPNTIGFNDDLEASAPCGGFNVTFANTTNFHVGGDAIALTSTHPAANWLFRATLDKTASGNWTDLLPVVGESGLGAFCENDIVLPSTWAGQQGIIQVIQSGPDGTLFQCAAVNFTAGTIAPPGSCKNATGVTAVFTSDSALSSVPATASMTGSATATASGSGTTTATHAASSAAAKSGAVSTKLLFAAEPLFWLSMLILGVAAAALMS